jgi:hypothetical protein
MPIQPGEFIYKNKLNWFQGNAIKYIWRADEKGAAIQDLEKAKWYNAEWLKRIDDERLAHEIHHFLRRKQYY